MLIEQAIQEFMLSRGGLRPKTQKEYRKHLELFQHSFPKLPEKPQPIQLWLNSLKRERGIQGEPLTPETIHARFRTLRAFYRQIQLWHPDIVNPMPQVRPPRLMPKAMRTFADEELYQLFSLPLSPRELALTTLLLDVGPRAQECVNLTWEDIIPGYVRLKGKTGERVVPISDITYRRLIALKAEDGSSQHIFRGKRGPLTYEGIYKLVRRLCRQAGVTGQRCAPHTFRHTFGTNYAAAEGCDPKVLQDIMGHCDFKTTLRYIQNNPRRMARNHQRCTPLKMLGGAAQGSFFDANLVIKEAESILNAKKWDPIGVPAEAEKEAEAILDARKGNPVGTGVTPAEKKAEPSNAGVGVTAATNKAGDGASKWGVTPLLPGLSEL